MCLSKGIYFIKVYTKNKIEIHPPHDHKHLLGNYHRGDETHVKDAIEAALNARGKWANMSWKFMANLAWNPGQYGLECLGQYANIIQ